MKIDSCWHDDDRRAVAHHEAGHAVMRWLLDQTISEVWIEPSGGMTIGKIILGDFDPEFMSRGEWLRAKKKLLVLLAGEYAERAYHEIAEDGIETYLSDHDRIEICQLLEKIGDHIAPLEDLRLQVLEDETCRNVEKNWDIIHALAGALLSTGRLSGVEAISLIESVTQQHGKRPSAV